MDDQYETEDTHATIRWADCFSECENSLEEEPESQSDELCMAALTLLTGNSLVPEPTRPAPWERQPESYRQLNESVAQYQRRSCREFELIRFLDGSLDANENPTQGEYPDTCCPLIQEPLTGEGWRQANKLLDILGSQIETMDQKKHAVTCYQAWALKFCAPWPPVFEGALLSFGGCSPSTLPSWRAVHGSEIWHLYQEELATLREDRRPDRDRKTEQKERRAWAWLVENHKTGKPAQIEKRLIALGFESLEDWIKASAE